MAVRIRYLVDRGDGEILATEDTLAAARARVAELRRRRREALDTLPGYSYGQVVYRLPLRIIRQRYDGIRTTTRVIP